MTKEVSVSGSVGKQVYSSTEPVILNKVIVTAVSATTVTVRDGNASGEVRLTLRQPVISSDGFDVTNSAGKGIRFDKGMHVKVIGTNSLAYLVIE